MKNMKLIIAKILLVTLAMFLITQCANLFDESRRDVGNGNAVQDGELTVTAFLPQYPVATYNDITPAVIDPQTDTVEIKLDGIPFIQLGLSEGTITPYSTGLYWKWECTLTIPAGDYSVVTIQFLNGNGEPLSSGQTQLDEPVALGSSQTIEIGCVPAHSTQLVLGGTFQGQLDVGHMDYFVVNATAGETYDITATASTGKTDLYVYRQTGAIAAHKLGDGGPVTLTYAATESETTYVGVYAAEASSFTVELKLNVPTDSFVQTYGDTGDDSTFRIAPTSDGGWIGSGRTDSSGAGQFDAVVSKLDGDGNVQWEQVLGGANNDAPSGVGQSVVQTDDGGFLWAGYTESFGAGGADVWVIRFDSSGNVLWERYYGGAGDDYGYAILATDDGNILVAGSTESFGNGRDGWLVKLDMAGAVLWEKRYGGNEYDGFLTLLERPDGYVVGGYAYSDNINIRDPNCDAGWLLNVDKTDGTIAWQQSYDMIGSGGWNYDKVYAVSSAGADAIVLAGATGLPNISTGAAGYQYWIMKLDDSGTGEPAIEWRKTFDSGWHDYAYAITATAEGGFLVGGLGDRRYSSQYSDYYQGDGWVLKLASDGSPEWGKAYGPIGTESNTSTGIERIYSVHEASQGYVLAGHTNSYGAGNNDWWLLKTDTNGDIPDGNIDVRTLTPTERTLSFYERTTTSPATGDNPYQTGNTYAAGVDYTDYVIVAGYQKNADGYNQAVARVFKPDGTLESEFFYDNVGVHDAALAVDVDDDNNIYLGGYTGKNGSWDIWVAKYDINGTQLWDVIDDYNGGDDLVRSVYYDNGYVYVAGDGDNILSSSSDEDMFMRKLSAADGQEVSAWNQAFNSNDNPDRAYSILCDPDGFVHLVGVYNYGSHPNITDWWIKRFNASGTEVNSFKVGTGYSGTAFEVDYNPSNNSIYICGTEADTGNQGEEWMIRKYVPDYSSEDTTGQWGSLIQNDGVIDACQAVAFGSDGSVYACGQRNYTYSGQMYDWGISKYSADGSLQWDKTFSSDGNLHDRAIDVEVDSQDNVYVAGYFSDSSGYYWMVKKYDADGAEDTTNWNYTFDSTYGDDIAVDLAVIE